MLVEHEKMNILIYNTVKEKEVPKSRRDLKNWKQNSELKLINGRTSPQWLSQTYSTATPF